MLFCLLCPLTVFGQATYVASSYAASSGGTCGNTCTLALGTSAPSGSIIIFGLKWQGSGTTVSSVSGTNGSCTLLTGTLVSDATNNDAGEAGYCLPSATAAYTVSVTMSAGTFQFNITEAAYTGQNATPIDVSAASNPDCAGTSCNGAAVTTTAANETLVSIGQEYSGNSINFAAGSGTLRGQLAGQSGYQDQTVVSAGAVTPTFSSASSLGISFMFSVAIKNSGGGASHPTAHAQIM